MLIVSAVTLVFGLIYEYFSFGVYSPYMLLAFLIPLLLGVVPCYILLKSGKKILPDSLAADLLSMGILTLTIGSLVKGALMIYGTDNPLLLFYPVVGALLLLTAGLRYVRMSKREKMFLPEEGEACYLPGSSDLEEIVILPQDA